MRDRRRGDAQKGARMMKTAVDAMTSWIDAYDLEPDQTRHDVGIMFASAPAREGA